MMAFDHVFFDVARREARAIQTVDRAGKSATFLFREFYCNDPGCDCRRVVLLVQWVEGKRVAASINYGFEPSKRKDEPQIFLDPMNPQSEYSRDLLALFTELIGTDREYRERLVRHYAMWKQVVDDPTHPQHAKLRSELHDDPAFRPAFPGRKPAQRNAARAGADATARAAKPGQAARPAAAKPAAAGSVALVAAKGARAEGKLQGKFRRLLEKVDGLKQRVRAWRDARADIDSGISLYAAAANRLQGLGHDMVGLLDRAYGDAAFSKADRKKLAGLIAELAGDLVEAGHEDLKPLYNRYSRGNFDAEVAEADAESAAALRSMMEAFGMELGDADVGSLDELKALVDAQLRTAEEEEAAQAERRARRKKSAKQVAAEARREDERRSTGKALQEVYRTLAKALHPDHEQDPAERARKSEVMREVNIAYEAKDLLRLLELQLELERVEPGRADAIAEGRLQHYNRILDEQATQLAAELEELELPFRMQLAVPPPGRLAPAAVIARLRADVVAVQDQIAKVVHDLEAFATPSRLKAWLRTQATPRGESRQVELDLFG